MAWRLAKSLIKLREHIDAAHPDRLRDMSPTSSFEDCANTSPSNTKLFRYLTGRNPASRQLSDCWDLLRLQFGCVYGGSERAQPGVRSVEHVLARRDVFQVLEAWIVFLPVFVVDLISARSRANKRLRNKAMDGHLFVDASIFAQVNPRVAVTVQKRLHNSAYVAAVADFIVRPIRSGFPDFCLSSTVDIGQGVNLLRLGLALARPVHSLMRVFGPLCILPQRGVLAHV